ncbi:MAG: RDD family protein [Pyrinomonadaceae bacterium]
MTARVERAATGRSEVIKRPRRQLVERQPAPFSLRCGAVLIDYVLLVGIVAFSTIVARMLGGGARSAGNSAETVGLLIAVGAAVLNLGIAPGLTGRTIGKWATGLRIERLDGGEPGIGGALLRHFVGYPVSLLTLGLGFLLAALSTRGRALHDLIAGTVVVRDAPHF